MVHRKTGTEFEFPHQKSVFDGSKFAVRSKVGFKRQDAVALVSADTSLDFVIQSFSQYSFAVAKGDGCHRLRSR